MGMRGGQKPVSISENDFRRLVDAVERIDKRLDHMEESVVEIQRRNNEIDNAMVASGFSDIREMVDIFRTSSIVLLGDEDLGIEPLRPMVENLNKAYSRFKWVAGTLATSNVGTLAAWLSTLLK